MAIRRKSLSRNLTPEEIEKMVKGGQLPKGFGDSVESFVQKITGGRVKPCTGCKKRKEMLNKMLPYEHEIPEATNEGDSGG